MSAVDDLTVLVCRGCCCGNPQKHPSTDHDAQLAALRAAAHDAGARLRVVGCLGECSASNLVVLRHRRGGPASWVGQVLDDERTADLAGWIAAGGPRHVGPPPSLAADTFTHHAPRHLTEPTTRTIASVPVGAPRTTEERP